MHRSLSLFALLLLLLSCSHGTGLPESPERENGPDEAARYFAMKRGITPELDINARYAAARERIQRMPKLSATDREGGWRLMAEAASDGSAWEFLGPGNVGGRTRALLIDPRDTNVMYAGAVSGGVWKTTDGGAHWSTMTDFLPNVAVCALAFDPNDANVIYAGTGEGYFREDIRGTNLPIRGNGIFVTRDAGATWQQLASTNGEDFYWVNDLAVSPHDSQRVYAATRNGVFRSRDGGQSWTRVVPTTVKGGCLDLALRADTANDFLFASCGTLDQATVYRATAAETDDAWTAVLSEEGMGRTSLAIAPSDPNVIYALSAQNGGSFQDGLHALFRSTEGGAAGTWTAQVRSEHAPTTFGPLLLTNLSSVVRQNCTSVVFDDQMVNMGWHGNAIAVDPQDPNKVFAGSVDLFRSDDGGRTWGIASYWWAQSSVAAYSHADHHAIVFDPHYDGAGNQRVFVTNDGGVYRTDNARAAAGRSLSDYCTSQGSKLAFHSLNHDFGATQFYDGAVFPDGQRYLGGAQDNSTPVGTDAGGVNGWQVFLGGDGGYVAVDPVTPVVSYGESQYAQIVRMESGRPSLAVFPQPGDYLFVSPFLLDPNQHTRIWLGGADHLLRNDNLGHFQQASAGVGAHITALAVAPGNSDRILFGTETGAIHRSDAALSANGSTQWISARPRDGWVSSITFDPFDTSVAYATYAGFGGIHVWKTADAGASWTPLDGSGDAALPDVPAHSLAIDGTRLYLGTDLGVFLSTDGGAHWAAESGFPHAITERLVIANSPRGRALYAFTHGRGAWRIVLPAPPRRRAVR